MRSITRSYNHPSLQRCHTSNQCTLHRWVYLFYHDLHNRPVNTSIPWRTVLFLECRFLKLVSTPYTVTGYLASNKFITQCLLKLKVVHWWNFIIFATFPKTSIFNFCPHSNSLKPLQLPPSKPNKILMPTLYLLLFSPYMFCLWAHERPYLSVVEFFVLIMLSLLLPYLSFSIAINTKVDNAPLPLLDTLSLGFNIESKLLL